MHTVTLEHKETKEMSESTTYMIDDKNRLMMPTIYFQVLKKKKKRKMNWK